MVSLEKTSEVELSTWIGVAGYEWPSSRRKVLIGTASWPLMYAAPISASAAEPITLDMMREMYWMGGVDARTSGGWLGHVRARVSQEIIPTSADAGSSFGEVEGVAVYVEDYITGGIPDRGVGVRGGVVE